MEYDKISTGNRAYEMRKLKNLKQSDVGAALGIHQTTYSKFELGQYDMPISELVKLCNLFDVSVSWLIGENIIAGLSDEERQIVENYIRYIKKVRNKLSN
jgi:transcriptional regulator with XRE-family HTH domain